MINEPLNTGCWMYVVDVNGKIVDAWKSDDAPDSDAAMDEGTRRVLLTGSDDACWKCAGQVDRF